MNKNIFIVILLVLILGLGGYLVYDKVLVKEEKDDNVEEKLEETADEKVYTYEEIAGKYYFEIEAEIKEMPGLKDRFYLVLGNDGTFTYAYRRDAHGGVIGNYMINGNVITLNYIASTNNGAGIGEILDKTHTLIINEDKSITDENVDLNSIFTSKITLSRDGIPSEVESEYYTFDEKLQEHLQATMIS